MNHKSKIPLTVCDNKTPYVHIANCARTYGACVRVCVSLQTSENQQNQATTLEKKQWRRCPPIPSDTFSIYT